MFRKLHLQLTLFCTLVTGFIFLVLTFICLFFAENSLKKNNYATFMTQLNAALIHLQEQETISHQWLNQLLEKSRLKLYLYDNGTPLFYQHYHDSETERTLTQEARHTAREKLGIDIFSKQPTQLTVHKEYEFLASDGQDYYASVGIIPKKNGSLSFLILSSQETLNTQTRHLQLIICLADLIALFALFLFSRYFTKKMIVPLEQNHRKQIQFIASASHELRSPLAVLRSGMEVLTKTADPKKQAHVLGFMQEESTRMQHLISDMLFLANSDSGQWSLRYEACQPDALLVNTFESYEPLAGKRGISLSIYLPEELIRNFYCDEERIKQVFSILMDNALSYTPTGGSIQLSLTLQKPFLLFQFSDTGCGVPDHEKALIFDRFYRSDHAHTNKEHCGLGLCIAKEIVTAHKGRIWVEDNPKGGSYFWVKLPCDLHYI